jgi:hypothetical protein
MNIKLGLCASLLLAGVGTAAADSIGCGDTIVDQGDTADALLAHCGQPDSKSGEQWI